MLKAAREFTPTVEFKDLSLKAEDAFDAVDFVKWDHPEIFWLSRSEYFSATHQASDGMGVTLTMSYNMTPAKARTRQGEIDRAIAPFLDSITPDMSDFDAVEQIYENMIKLVDYDSIMLLESKKQPKTNKPDDLRNIYGVFVKRKAVCAGYAEAMQYLLNKIGIECIYVKGDTPRGYHAWNVLKLEGDYYIMDATWGDGSDTDKSQSHDHIGYNYFCVNDEIGSVDHTPDMTFSLPACTSMACNWHRRHNLWIDKYTRKAIEEAVVQELQRGRNSISLRFPTEAEIDRAENDLIGRQQIYDVFRRATQRAGVSLGSSPSWTRHSRVYTLTLYVTRL
ncbi:MAG: hypothetical protein IKZ21_03610 [Clostridia bacterium]|nr:hypothetical protein [Clostridia bacterium]